MQMKLNVILSAHRPSRTPAQDVENARRANALQLWLHEHGLNFTAARGAYKGVEERSVVVQVTNDGDYDELLDHAFAELQQESVLVVNPVDGAARLHFENGDVKSIGYMHEAPEHVARARDAWTRVVYGAGPSTAVQWFVVSDEVPF